MITAKWKEGFGLFTGIDPNKVADEIQQIGENATPQEIVDRAKDETSELHKCFEWDDTVAASRYRLQQARYIVHHLVIQETSVPADRPEIRYFFKTKSNEGYTATQTIVRMEDEYKSLLAQAYAELQAFKRKYSCLEELREIFDLID